ncbi:MAG: response regulator transcription factor [Pirellula sp.]
MARRPLDLLVVEDDVVLGKALVKGLTEAGHVCKWVQSGSEAVDCCKNHLYEIAVLDLMLPDLSGLEVLREFRIHQQRLAVLILSALGTVEERVLGLNSGADDYLVKPFAFAELIARLSVLERRKIASPVTRLQFGSLAIELTSRRVTRDDQEIDLTQTEYKLLEFLMRNAGEVVTRRMLCEHLWESDWEGVTNVIEVHINRLRNKLNKGFDSGLIYTIRGSGYELRQS